MPHVEHASIGPALRPDARTITLPEFVLSNGAIIAPVTLAYETWGTLAATSDNAVLICHALTGDAHAFDEALP